MPYPQAKPDDPVHLKTFDPHTFYPAIAARHISGSRQDSVSTFPSRSICEPEIPENFDPATFYPALAAREKLKLREGSVDADSIYPSSSISQPTLPRSERPRLRYSDRELHPPRVYSRRRLWIIGISFFVSTTIIVLVFAWLGAHNFFTDQKLTFP